jgi:hypothetical protein
VRVVFVDYDGVLNVPTPLEEGRTGMRVSAAAVAALNRIVRVGRARVVVSSAWRADYTARNQRHLRGWGVRCTVVGQTPQLWEAAVRRITCAADLKRINRRRQHTRGREIAAWLRAHPEVTGYAILDDEDDMWVLRRRLVQTDLFVGLTDEHADRALELLARPVRR